MKEAIDRAAKGEINSSVMITHIGGLNAVVETTKNLPKVPGGKKLIYTHEAYGRLYQEGMVRLCY